VLSAEKQLEDTKFLIRDTKRKSRMAQTPEEQKQYQEEIKKLERLQRRQRQEIFDVEDEIEARRDQLIDVLEKRMKQRTQVQPLFRIHWQLA
jgi:predicted  nucleic acid-binding Zn-ribbon protein